ncbi:thiamine phosphate synthase [Paraglaciecola sp. 20A4]|uniref:thiamine phosphate synthase n=1 Tax=Paraglaciecola sp. 20A4 TaxID=2687288 RepID=UPI00140D2DF5|nr:thiamine phosphate synthase [Paraglaciecola sp. 20A4]
MISSLADVSHPYTKASKPSVLTFSGSDSAGLAGMQMDVKVQHALGAHCLSVITAVTAQNNQQMLAIQAIDRDMFNAQIRALSVFSARAIKTGLIANNEQAHIIAHTQQALGIPLIFDPVRQATNGGALRTDSSLNKDTISDIMLPHCTLVTPNIPEAEKLAGISIRDAIDIKNAAQMIVAKGVKAVLIKGGHAANDGHIVADYFCTSDEQFWLKNERVETRHTRGTGCALASAIASCLALGYCLKDALVIAKMTITQGLLSAKGLSIEKGISSGFEKDNENELAKGPVNVQAFPDKETSLPILLFDAQHDVCSSEHASKHQILPPFPDIGDTPLGLYPIVDRAAWLETLLPLGVSTIQLRIKDLTGQALEDEISLAVCIAKRFQCRLFINDYWQLAIKHGAYGVHLGQEDLIRAKSDRVKQITQIYAAGLRLGISTHCHFEVATAHGFRPSYIAYGPVFATNSKDMPWVPQGLKGLEYWQKLLDYPLVAIGGIDQLRAQKIHALGVSGIAMISQITHAEDPIAATKALLAITQK